jgi:ribosomal protein S18 acetylase RimI-like enzyme
MNDPGEPAIRPYRESDFARTHALCVAAFEPIHAGFAAVLGPILFDAHYRNWRERYVDTIRAAAAPDGPEEIHVFERDGAVLGFVVTRLDATNGIGEIGLIAVDPVAQRQGIGHALVRFALAAFAEAGARSACVGTGGDAAHARARALYEAAGFDRTIPAVHYHRAL